MYPLVLAYMAVKIYTVMADNQQETDYHKDIGILRDYTMTP